MQFDTNSLYLLIVPSLLYYFNTYIQHLYNYIQSYFIVTFKINAADNSNINFKRWIENNVKKYEIVNYKYYQHGEFIPLNFNKFFLYKKIPIYIEYDENYKSMKVKTLNIKDIDLIVNEFLKDIYETKNDNNNSNFVSVYKYTSGWFLDVVIPFENITYIQSNKKDNKYFDIICSDYDKFLLKKEFYMKRNLTFKRCYFLYGPPGTGKTSLIQNFAYKYKMSIYNIITTKCTSIHDMHYMMKINKNGIIVLEDIDTLFANKSDITLSGLLNIFDSHRMNDKVIFMTTNYPERLAPSFIRPGRVDFKLKIEHCDKSMIYNMITDYRPELCKKDKHKLVDIFYNDYSTLSAPPSIAEIQSYLLYHLDNDIDTMMKEWNTFNKLQNCFKFVESDIDTDSINSETSIISR